MAGKRLANARRLVKTPTFARQQFAISIRADRGDKDAARLKNEVLVALAHLEANPCVGYRMRGLPFLESLCAYHFPAPFRRWRIIYKLTSDRVQLILLGEHWKSIGGVGSRGGAKIAGRLGFDDIYDAVAALHGGFSKRERKSVRDAVRQIEKERCC